MPIIGTPSRVTWIGIAAEATPGTAEAAPKIFIPVEPGAAIGMKPVTLRSKDLRATRAGITAQRQGVKAYVGKLSGTFFGDSTTALLRSALGKDTITTVSTGVYDHVLKLENSNPIALTLFWNVYNTSGQTEVYTYCVVDKFTLKWDVAKGLLLWEAEIIAMKKVTDLAGAVPTPSFTALQATAGWEAVYSKAGSQFGTVTKGEIAITNDWEPFYGSPSSGSPTQEGTDMMPGDHNVTGKISYLLTKAQYDKFLADTQESNQVVFTGLVIATTYYNTLTVLIPQSRYSKDDRDTGSKLIMLDEEFDGLLDSSSASVATITVRNGSALSVY